MTKRTTKKTASKIKKPSPRTKAVTKRHSMAHSGEIQRQFEFNTEGVHFDLREIFDRLNAKYFGNRLKRYHIMWGRRRKQRPQSYIVFGSIQEQDRVIRIHPLLDREFVPSWYIDYVVFHEMLHAFVPDKYDRSGRRIIHHEGFLAREREFTYYQRAVKWEQQNLARFLR
jgi:hypothetical protein